VFEQLGAASTISAMTIYFSDLIGALVMKKRFGFWFFSLAFASLESPEKITFYLIKLSVSQAEN
jgi:hypothetical protein